MRMMLRRLYLRYIYWRYPALKADLMARYGRWWAITFGETLTVDTAIEIALGNIKIEEDE